MDARLARLYPGRETDAIPVRDPDATASGWVPQDPGGSEVAGGPEVTAIRRRAQSTALEAYVAAHGHPLDRPEPGVGGRRWVIRPRVAVAGSLVLVVLAVLVVLRSNHVASVVVDGSAAVVDGRSAGADGVAGGVSPVGGVPEPGVSGQGGWEAGSSEGGGVGGGTLGAVQAEGVSGDRGAGSASDGTTGTGDVGVVVVHVVGQVAAPGVVRLAAGARVVDAIDAAGGASTEADLGAVNLARVLVDGEQVVVPRPGEPVAPVTSLTGTAQEPGGGPLDLNTADATALDALPGIGPVLAERIVQWRTDHGRFSSVDELAEVRGVGPSLLADLRDLVRT